MSHKDLYLTKEQMVKLGYKDPTNDEAYIFNRIGDEGLEIILDTAERFSEIEADELEIQDKHSDSYRIIQKANRVKLTGMVVAEIKAMKVGQEYTFIPATDYDMKMVVKAKYAEKLPESEQRLLR